jgi:hypothetical protein
MSFYHHLLYFDSYVYSLQISKLCMYVCMYVRVYVCMNAWVYVLINVCV